MNPAKALLDELRAYQPVDATEDRHHRDDGQLVRPVLLRPQSVDDEVRHAAGSARASAHNSTSSGLASGWFVAISIAAWRNRPG